MRTAAIFAVVLSAAFLPAAPASSQVQPDADAAPGLTIVHLDARPGRVRVYLPDDMRAGDTISGTVTSDPAGRSDEQRQHNGDQLNGYVVEIEGVRAHRAGHMFSFIVPAAGASSLTLLSPDGRPAAPRTRIPTIPVGATAPSSRLPVLGQQGRPLEILGPFDGDSTNTTARIGGVPAQIIAESPRSAVIRVPDGAPGPVLLQVSEGETRREGSFNRVVISLNEAGSSPR